MSRVVSTSNNRAPRVIRSNISQRQQTVALTLRAQLAPLSVIAAALRVNWEKAGKIVAYAECWGGQLRHRCQGEVYFIEMRVPGGENPIKVGWSTFPERRCEDLQTGSPFALYLLASYRAPHTEEAVVLNRLGKSRLRGEWFRPTEEVFAEIAKHTYRGVMNG